MCRRLFTIPLCFLLAAVAAFSSPLWVPAFFLVDRARRHGSSWLRAGAMLTTLVVCEALALTAAFLIWVRAVQEGRTDQTHDRARNFAIQRWWTRTLLSAATRLFRLEIEVEGNAAASEGPLLLLARHVSVGDILLPAVLIADRHDILIRYVAKATLQWDPCLDVLGGRLSSYFVERSGHDSAGEAARVGELIRGLPAAEAVLLFPEGTRFTPEKRLRILRRLERNGETERLRYARSLRNVLPPRLGGALHLLQENRGADVLLVRHTGLEGIETLSDLLGGALTGRRIRVSFRRFAFDSLPQADSELEAWLLERWREVDAWVTANQPPYEADHADVA